MSKFAVDFVVYIELTVPFSNKNISNHRLISQSKALAKKIRALADRFGFRIIQSLEDPFFNDHRQEVNKVRYNTLNDFFKQIVFSIIVREARLAQPGTSGKFDIQQNAVYEI